MNVFGVGPLELIVILVVALIFVGPERLPRLAADVARTIREIRRYTGSVAAEFNEVVREFERETEGERSQWREISQGLSEASASVNEALRDARADADLAAAGAPPPAPPAPGPAPAANGAAANGHTAAPAAAPADAEGAVWKDIPPRATPAQEAPGSPAEEPR